MELLGILIIFFLASVVSLMVKRRVIIESLSVISAASAAVTAFVVASKVASSGSYLPYQFFAVDALGAIMLLIIGIVGLVVAVYSIWYLRSETAKGIIGFTRIQQFYILLNLFLAVMMLAVMSSNPIFTWISIEATTLSTAFLISFYNKPSAMEAAWKYLLLNATGLLLAFLGTLLYFTAVSQSDGASAITWSGLLAQAGHLDPIIAKIAFIFVLIGYGTKVGLVPMHTWLPDAHSKAPPPISALLSGVLLNVAFITIVRLKGITDIAIGSNTFTQHVLVFFGLLSIVVAALIIFTQKNYKRLLAYSSIENMGIATLGIGLGGLGTLAALLHVIYHALIKSALFLLSGTIFLRYSTTKIARILGIATALPVTGTLFFLSFFAITGTPPFGIFLTKIYILTALLRVSPWLAVIMIVSTAILFVGFFRHVMGMVFGQKPEDIQQGGENMWLIIPPLALIILALYLSWNLPPLLLTLLNHAAIQ